MERKVERGEDEAVHPKDDKVEGKVEDDSEEGEKEDESGAIMKPAPSFEEDLVKEVSQNASRERALGVAERTDSNDSC